MSGFVDDVGIGNDARLLRRIHPKWVSADKPDSEGLPGLTSQAFEDLPGSPGMSVGLADEIERRCLDLSVMLDGHPGYGLVVILAGIVRQVEWIIVHDGEGDPWHALVIGEKRRAKRKVLVDAAQWLVRPTPPLA